MKEKLQRLLKNGRVAVHGEFYVSLCRHTGCFFYGYIGDKKYPVSKEVALQLLKGKEVAEAENVAFLQNQIRLLSAE